MALEEEGIVKAVEGDHALVTICAQGVCQGCPSAGICNSAGDEREVKALNPVNAAPGQRVKVVMHAQMYLKGTLLVYALPMFVLIAGAVLGKYLADSYFPDLNPDVLAAGLGLGGMAAVFIVVKRWSRVVEESGDFLPVVERILTDDDRKKEAIR